MRKHPVVFIAFEEFDNLGVGYLAAILENAGFNSILIDPRKGENEILSILRRVRPVLVGFSVIFQYHITEFQRLIKLLRSGGIKCHFTAGGHYASLRFEELFNIIPWLDSVVRFEGEYTLLELTRYLNSGRDWKQLTGIAYKNGENSISNPLRPPEIDLDWYPFPIRSSIRRYAFDKNYTSIIAGRGCLHNCSFCNMNKFFRHPGWPLKRKRRPAMIIREMEMLYHEKNCSIFLFEDDDFPISKAEEDRWISEFCDGLRSLGLGDKILWKINCRPDEIDERKFKMMKDQGLFLIFCGIEDGTDIGLKTLNKNLTVSRIISGINTLKKLKIGIDYGFILFQPGTTFTTLYKNIDFLKNICGDGYSPVSFLRMMPYYETKVEEELKKQGRLKGEPGFRTYDFIEVTLDLYYNFIMECFSEWLRSPDGLVNISKWARNNLLVFSRYFETGSEFTKMSQHVTQIISESNMYLLDAMSEIAVIFETGKEIQLKKRLLNLKKLIYSKHEHYKDEINITMSALMLLSCEYNPLLLNYL